MIINYGHVGGTNGSVNHGHQKPITLFFSFMNGLGHFFDIGRRSQNSLLSLHGLLLPGNEYIGQHRHDDDSRL